MARNVSDGPESQVRHRGSPHHRSPPRRERSSPVGIRSSHKGSSLEKDRHSAHGKSPTQSPSPQTKRLKRAQAEDEAEKVKQIGYDKHRGIEKGNGREREGERDRGKEKEKMRDRGRERERERGLDREVGNERRDRRSERDEKHSRGRHERSTSPSDHNHRRRHLSHSPQRAAGSRRDEGSNSRGSKEHDDESDSLARMKAAEEALDAQQKDKPSFELSGKLAAETNKFRGVTLLFNEPQDARKPNIKWRLYVFKAGEVLNEPLYIHRQSCYLFGRERRVADIPTDHPSCSKQHAVIQFRQVEKEIPDGTMSKQVRPYVMDLGSTNKTYVNDNPIEPQHYYELFEKDTIKFGNSSREYVLLHENSAGT